MNIKLTVETVAAAIAIAAVAYTVGKRQAALAHATGAAEPASSGGWWLYAGDWI